MLPGVLLAAVSLSVADASTATVRSTVTGHEVALDLNTTPRAELRFGRGPSTLSLGYSPSFAWVDVTRDGSFALLHSATATYGWSEKRLRLTLAIAGSIGRQSYLTVGSIAPAPVDQGGGMPTQPAPATPSGGTTPPANTTTFFPQREIVETGSFSVSLGTTYQLTRRWTLTDRIGYDVSGGLGDSKSFVPLRRGPTASATVDYLLTRDDSVASSVSWSLVDVPSRGSRFTTVTLLETWRHRFAIRTLGRIGAGGTFLRSRDAAHEPTVNSLLAAGLLGFSQGWILGHNEALSFSANGNLGAEYNPVLGEVRQRIGADAGWDWSKDRTSLGCRGQVSQTLPLHSPNAALLYGASVNASYHVADPLAVSMGAAWTRQVLPSSLAVADVSSDQWRVFLTLTLVAPALDL